jgi:hypothetical protein
MEPPSCRSSNRQPTHHRPGACPLAVGGQGSSHQSPRQGTEVGAAHLAGRGRQLSSARVACAVLATVIGVVGLHIQPTRLCSPPRGHRVGLPWSDSGDRHQPEGGTMDTSRRPDGPIDSRADQQLRQPQGLQLMKWILSWIQSRPLRWLPSPRAIIDTADASRSSGCTSAGAPGLAGPGIADRGRQRPPAWRLGASGGRRRGASGADRSGARCGARHPARSYLCLRQAVNTVVPAQAVQSDQELEEQTPGIRLRPDTHPIRKPQVPR